MTDRPRVSLYIPCYNVERFIAPCLEAALRQTVPFDEILVVDDGSTDGTATTACKYPVRIVSHGRNRGLAAGRNTGLREARNDLVAALDADCVADARWLEVLLEEMADPRVAVAGGRLVESVLETLADRWRRAHMSQDWGDRRVVSPVFMYGNNALLRKAAVAAVGPYDERYRTNGEDMDLTKRLRAAGFASVYRPDAVVKHLRQDTVRSIFDTYWRYTKFGMNLHVGALSPLMMLVHVGYSLTLRVLRKVAWRDLLRGNWELLGLDLLLPFYLLRRYAGLVGERASAAPARPQPR
jgi:GT2 family glycosyltransferase